MDPLKETAVSRYHPLPALFGGEDPVGRVFRLIFPVPPTPLVVGFSNSATAWSVDLVIGRRPFDRASLKYLGPLVGLLGLYLPCSGGSTGRERGGDLLEMQPRSVW